MRARDELTAEGSAQANDRAARRPVRVERDAPAPPRSGTDELELSLARRERQLARMQRLAGFGAWEWDLPGDRVHWSDEVYAILGLSAGSLEPSFEAYRRMVYAADRDALDAAVRAAIDRAEGYQIEHRVVRPDGELRWVRTVGDVQLDARGVVVGLYVLVQDVTGDLEAERRKEEILRARFAREEARVAEQRVHAVLEAIPQQVWVVDAIGRVLMVNERVSAYFAIDIEHLSSERMREAVHPEDYERAATAWREARGSRTALSVELRLRSAAGEYRWHLCRAEPQLGSSGEIERWIGTNTDVHTVREAQAERARAEREARHERRRLRTIFERAPAAICITRGPSHLLMAANAAFRALLPTREVIGEPIRASFPSLGDHSIASLLDHVYETGQPYVGREVPLRYGDAGDEGPPSYINLVLQPLADGQGVIEGVLLHAGDVTDTVHARLAVEEKAAELEELTRHLEAANEELDRFAYVTSHDLRAPLRGISNLVAWIDEDLREDASAETHQHLELLRGRVRRLERLIDGILQYSRAGRSRHTLETVDVGRLIDDLRDLLAPPPDASIEAVGAMPVLITERVPLAQVLQNLIDNALTHGRRPDGVHVRVTCERRESAWCFAVSDDGPGIDPRFHERIWRMFQTLGGDGHEATGIGLSLVRKIVEGRGGRVWIESRPGDGATFRFTWPEMVSRSQRRSSGTMRAVGRRTNDRAGNG